MVGVVEMKALEGTCRYCGTIQPVMAADQTDADNKISADCPCGGAAKAKKRIHILENIDAIAGDNAVKMGFSSVEGGTLSWLKRTAELVLEGKADKVSVDIDGTKIVIGITSKGDVKVKRNKTASVVLEA